MHFLWIIRGPYSLYWLLSTNSFCQLSNLLIKAPPFQDEFIFASLFDIANLLFFHIFWKFFLTLSTNLFVNVVPPAKVILSAKFKASSLSKELNVWSSNSGIPSLFTPAIFGLKRISAHWNSSSPKRISSPSGNENFVFSFLLNVKIFENNKELIKLHWRN